MNPRRFLLFLIALMVLIGSLLSALAVHLHEQALSRGVALATQPGEALPYRAPLAGVNAHLAQYTPAELNTQLDAMAQMGITWVRQYFPWAAMEPEPGVFDWEAWDRIVAAVADHDDLRLVAVLHAPPAWARRPAAQNNPTAPPRANESFAAFAAAFAQRYEDAIDEYQIWDEPNLTAAWGGLPPSPAEYAGLLEAAYTAIHAVDPAATVIAAALAPTTEQGPDNLSDVLYLRALYELGAGAYFDAAAGKPYGFATGPDDRRVDEQYLNLSRLILLREEMLAWGDGEKPLWGSAFGWNALPSGWAGSPSIWGDVLPDEQVAFTAAALTRAAEEWPWCGGLVLYHWEPDADPADPVWGFAVRPNASLLSTVRDTLSAYDGGQVALPGRHPVDTPSAEYTGEWEFGALGGDFGYEQDSALTFTFWGTDLALELRRDNYRGYLFVTIDGQPANALQRDQDGRSYIILNSSDNQPQLDVIPVATGLPAGPHVLHAKAEFGWDQWALAGYRVGVRPASLQGVIPALLAVATLAAIALMKLKTFTVSAAVMRRFGSSAHAVGHLALGGLASMLLMIGMFLTWTGHTPTLLRREWPGLILGFLTTGLMYYAEPFLLTVGMALLLWFLIYARLELGLLLTLVWLPFFLYPLSLHEYAFPVAEVCILLTTSAWIVKGGITWARQRPLQVARPRLTRVDWGVIAFFALATFSLLWADFRHVALREWRTMILEPVLFYAIARTTLRTRAEVIRLVDAFVVGAVAAAAVSLALYVSGENIVMAEGASRRLAGVYGSPNNVGLIMGRALPFALAPLLAEATRRRKAWAIVASTLIAVAALLSQSAGALLMGIPASLFLLLFLRHRRLALIAAGLGVAGGAALAYPVLQSPRFSRLLDFSSGSTFFRLRIWESALAMIRDRPLQGFGLDQFLYQYRGHYIRPDAWQEPNISHPHNILLDFWIRLGIGGVLILLWLQAAFWRAALSVYGRLKSSELLAMVNIAAMASMADLLIHGLIDNSVFVIDLSFVFVCLLVLPELISRVMIDASSD